VLGSATTVVERGRDAATVLALGAAAAVAMVAGAAWLGRSRETVRANALFLGGHGEGHFLYHETRREHLDDIAHEGLWPTSYGQSFVREDGSVASPEEALDDVRAELESELDFEDLDEEAFETRVREVFDERHPPEDLAPRTYVMLSEPASLKYGEVLLRFPRSTAPPTRRHDVDWCVRGAVPPSAIEVLDGGRWRRLA